MKTNRLYHVRSEGYEQVIRAQGDLEAAKIAFGHAREIGPPLRWVAVSSLAEPEDGGRGICYESATPRIAHASRKKRMVPRR